MQALRQAQAQQQQQVIQEQRAQGIARINRQMSSGEENNSTLPIQLQVSTTQVIKYINDYRHMLVYLFISQFNFSS